MGNSSAKNNDKGGILITLQNDSARCGEEVSGQVNISVKKPLGPSTLYLSFKGKEETHWEERKRLRRKPGEKKVQVHIGKAVVCNPSYIISKWDKDLPKGGYVVPFTFKLPADIPSSFYYSQGGLKASIRYKFSALLISENNEKIKAKQPMHISQHVEKFSTDINLHSQASLRSWCCLDKGSTILSFQLGQDAFNPSQVIEVEADLNNSNSQLGISRVHCRFYYSLRVKSSENHTNFTRVTLLETSSTLSNSGLLQGNSVTLALKLPSIKNRLEKMYSTRGKLIDCIYHLEVKARMDGWFMCFGETPKITQQIFIVPNVIAIPTAPEAPLDWNPQELSPVYLEFQETPKTPVVFSEVEN